MEQEQPQAIEEIIGAHTALMDWGHGRLSALCPFHRETTPSFVVYPSTGRWRCFGCQKEGDAASFTWLINSVKLDPPNTPRTKAELQEQYGTAAKH